ncbi:MAG TPA: CBS domain-containing protein [Candidatus Binataceae bacterium]|nr:CBS domain-containing protein [Candidatus Binataceae bacterium]
MLVANRMSKNPQTASPRDTLAEAEAKMHAGNFRHLPIVADGKLVGMLSDHDIRQHQGHLKDTRVTGAMTDNPITVTPDTSLEEAAEILLERKIGGLPVVANEKLVGMITTTDILSAFVEIFGTAEENATRVDLMMDSAPPRDLPHASEVIQKSGGEILGLGTYRDRWKEERVYYLVVRANPIKPVIDALAGNGFRVLGSH